MSNRLKPCPFCGGEAALHKIAFFKHEAYVRCKTCGVRTLEFSSATMEDAKLKAIEAWNTRKPMDEIEKRLVDAAKSGEVIMDSGVKRVSSFVQINDAIEIVRKCGAE